MKTVLLTAYDDTMAPIGDLTSPLMLAYANRHGFDFRCTRNIAPGHHYWQKIWDTQIALDTYDRVIWMDADQLITNPRWTPTWFTGFHASLDWGTDASDESQFSACAFVCGQDMIPFIDTVANLYSSYKDAPFPEQTAMRGQYVGGGEWKYRIRVHHRRQFNAVPKEISPDVPEPWQPGDWCAHLTHVPMERRAELFHIIVRQTGL